MQSSRKPIPPGHELEKVADLADTTLQTVRNYLLCGPGKPRIAARIAAALAELGYLPDGSRAADRSVPPVGQDL